jgi:biopolymer transport protein ExbB/TolQ
MGISYERLATGGLRLASVAIVGLTAAFTGLLVSSYRAGQEASKQVDDIIKAGGNLNTLSQNTRLLATSFDAMQAALAPAQDALKEVQAELLNAFLPVIKENMPDIIIMFKAMAQAIHDLSPVIHEVTPILKSFVELLAIAFHYASEMKGIIIPVLTAAPRELQQLGRGNFGPENAGNAAPMMGLFGAGAAGALGAGQTIINNYGVTVTPHATNALKPYLDQYSRQAGGR